MVQVRLLKSLVFVLLIFVRNAISFEQAKIKTSKSSKIPKDSESNSSFEFVESNTASVTNLLNSIIFVMISRPTTNNLEFYLVLVMYGLQWI